MKRNAVFWIILVMVLGFHCPSFAGNGLVFTETPIEKVLDVLSANYGVCIVKDPSVQGVVNATINPEMPIESVFADILAPLGYSFTVVDKVYLISGADSPRTIFVEWESYRIPVGFLDSNLQGELAKYSPYFKYDVNLGIIFIKAPSSKINEILKEIWSVSSLGAQTTVIYSICVVDMMNIHNEVDRLFEVTHGDNRSIREGTITPEQIKVAADWEAVFGRVNMNRKDRIHRQPWMAVLPGKTTQFLVKSHYVGDEPEEDQQFRLRITPLLIHPDSGSVTTKIELDGDENRKGSVTTTVTTRPGVFEPLAIVRRNNLKKERFWFGYSRQRELRTFGLFLMAIPLNVQPAFALSHSNVIPVANLEGLNPLEGTGDTEPSTDTGVKRELLLGFTKEKREFHPWFTMNFPVNKRMIAGLEYEDSERYELKLKWDLEYLKGASWELKVGEGNGPHQCSALLFGLTDETKSVYKTTLFASYYLTYSLDDRKIIDSGFWEVGARYGEGPLRLGISALSGSKVDSYKIRLEWDYNKFTWVLGADDVKRGQRYKLGVKFRF